MRRAPWVLLAALAVTTACGLTEPPVAPRPEASRAAPAVLGVEAIPPLPARSSWAPEPQPAGELAVAATAGDGSFTLHTASGGKDFLPGVNLGATVPGHAPGELAVDAATYRSWFSVMAAMGLRAVRVYTIHPPAFYAELAAYNEAHPDAPLYLVQGVYLPDESYAEGEGTLYDDRVTRAFAGELLDASAAVHGDLRRGPTPGRASGAWTADVSRWTAAWVIGIELDPAGVLRTDRRHAATPAVAGRWFTSAADAGPTERWLAARMDELAGAEAARGTAAPIAFVNWPTTDPLDHPDEPLEGEDLVGLDANHVVPTPAWPAGTFASYHAYPYYPDFLRHEAALARTVEAGRPDPYAGYLAALRAHHGDVPVLVTEFGVPSSLGSAHSGTLGRDQGGHSETEALRIDADLLRLIAGQGLAGGFVFAWADEWFKATWNTLPRQVPADRRPLWHDPLTNEQWFGLLAQDPLGPPDGGARRVGGGGGPAREVTVAYDEAWVEVAVSLRGAARTVVLDVDVLPGLPGPESRVEVDLAAGAARLLVRAEQDGTRLDRLPAGGPRPDDTAPGPWVPFRLTTSRPLTVPTTGASLPAEFQEVGLLQRGSWEPQDPAYDSTSTWQHRSTSPDGDSLLRVRVPWSGLGLADPSSRRALVVAGGKATTAEVERLGLDVVVDGRVTVTDGITWSGWDVPRSRARVKAGIGAFTRAVADVTP